MTFPDSSTVRISSSVPQASALLSLLFVEVSRMQLGIHMQELTASDVWIGLRLIDIKIL